MTATALAPSRYVEAKEASIQGTVFHKTLTKATPLRHNNPLHTGHSAPSASGHTSTPTRFEGDTEDASLISHGDRSHTPSGEQNMHRYDL